MYLKEIEYIVKIAEEKSLSRAAEKLFLTPSALTQQLYHLEQDLGAPLFVRSRGDWTLTEAGEVYLENARKMLSIKKETSKRIQDIAQTKKGTLSIGFPPDRGSAMFTSVYPEFHKRFPEIRVSIYEQQTKQLQKLIAANKLDLAFMVVTKKMQTGDVYIPLTNLELVLVLPEMLYQLQSFEKTEASSYPELALSAVCKEPFAVMFKESTVRDLTEQILKKTGLHLDVLFETARIRTIIEMANAGLCCGIIPECDLLPTDRVKFCSLPEHPGWNICACYRQGAYLSEAMQCFIELAGNYWNVLYKGSSVWWPKL